MKRTPKAPHKTTAQLIDEQRRWIAEHGATLAGYVARYGRADDPNKHGNGGAAIYAADVAELQRLEARRRGRAKPLALRPAAYLEAAQRAVKNAVLAHVQRCEECALVDVANCNRESFCTLGGDIWWVAQIVEVAYLVERQLPLPNSARVAT